MNGEPLSVAHGAPLRFLATERYGIVSVKWLKRIEVRDRRLMTQSGSSRPQPRSRAVAERHRIIGAVWGAYIRAVEVQIEDGPWQKAAIEPGDGQHEAWGFWFFDWPNPEPGVHTITSRATDKRGNVQPAMADPMTAKKHTRSESNGQIARRVMI